MLVLSGTSGLTLPTPLVSGSGGTGLSSAGTAGYVLTSNGTDWIAAAPTGNVTTTGSQTLTNKTIALSSNSISGTLAQFNTAVTDADLVSLAGIETLTNKTLTTPTISGATFNDGYTEETVTANTGTAYTIDLANGTVQILTLTGTCTYTFPTAVAGKSFLLVQKQDNTGSRTVTWGAAVKWPANTAPTITSTASKADIFSFVSDGTYWYGRTIGQNYL